LQYYYYPEELLAEQCAKPRTRAETLLDGLGRYFDHYREEAEKERPVLRQYRGRIDLGRFTILGDFAVHVLDAIANDRSERFMLNVPNRGATAQFPDGRVVEVPVVVNGRGAQPLPVGQIEPELAQFLQNLAEYQHQAAVAGWRGTRHDAVAAMALDPLVGSRAKAEAIYNEMAAAHRPYLPERLH
jgi:6-phospho-beta-glucosidase